MFSAEPPKNDCRKARIQTVWAAAFLLAIHIKSSVTCCRDLSAPALRAECPTVMSLWFQDFCIVFFLKGVNIKIFLCWVCAVHTCHCPGQHSDVMALHSLSRNWLSFSTKLWRQPSRRSGYLACISLQQKIRTGWNWCATK